MAAKMKTRTLSQAQMKAVMKPVISTDVMGNRNVEIKPVGAWVQPASHEIINRIPNPIEAAAEEEARILNMQREKRERLQRFQEDVKKRVRHIDEQKKQQQAQLMLKALEQERNILRQSAASAERLSSRKDSCLIHKHNGLSITTKSLPASQDETNSEHRHEKPHAFSNQSNQVHRFTTEARRKLGGRQVVMEESMYSELPGGMWRVSHTRDHPASRHQGMNLRHDDEDDSAEEEMESYDEEEKYKRDEQEEEQENQIRRDLKTVHFDLSAQQPETRQERLERLSVPSISGTIVNRPTAGIPVPEIYMGVAAEENKRRQRGQIALYRRLFMDQEREQVKENLRRQEHRKRIKRLKQDKELARRAVEDEALRLVQPRDPVTGETSNETFLREHLEQMQIQESFRTHEQLQQKMKETERYLDALRMNLRYKIEKQGLELPPLCCCGETLWDTNPDTCANNCYFYKNPKAYTRALQSLLVSCEVVAP